MYKTYFQDHENKLRQDLRNLAAHAAILTDRINTLKMVPALFGVVDFWWLSTYAGHIVWSREH